MHDLSQSVVEKLQEAEYVLEKHQEAKATEVCFITKAPGSKATAN